MSCRLSFYFFRTCQYRLPSLQNAQPFACVRDNGVGFSVKYSEKLLGDFLRLYRIEVSDCTGTGLATLQRTIHKHGGRIWTEGVLDKGDIFYFVLEGQAEDWPQKEVRSGGVA
jgi:light-regulated signal transduction histidine kinase (bacteriophytochrome)